MFNKITILILFTILSTLVNSNPIQLKGVVIDYESGKPVPYANVAIVEVKNGTMSDYKGYFELTIDSTDLKGTLNVSCLNYKNLTVKLAVLSMYENNKIIIKPLIYNIPEVIVKSKNSQNKIVLNKIKKSEISESFFFVQPRIFARYFPCNKECGGFTNIKYLNIGFAGSKQNENYKVRIRIFANDVKSNKPTEDILYQNLIITSKLGVNKVDISEYNIKMPSEGIFVAVEWLKIEANSFNVEGFYENDLKNGYSIYGPILGGVFSDKPQTWIYWAGDWRKYEKEFPTISHKRNKGNFIDAAISITLAR